MATAQFDGIVVEDTSPTVFYSPFRDTLGTPDFTAGWNPLVNRTSLGGAPLDVGNSTTVHVTSRDGASLSINFQGTGIQLFGSTVQASIQVSLDSVIQRNIVADPSNSTLFNVQNLPNANHTIILTTNTIVPFINSTQSFVVFDKAVIQLPPPVSAKNFTFRPLDDHSITFSGSWNNSLQKHQSTSKGDSAQASFNGAAFQLTGNVSPLAGNYSVTLDNITSTFSAQASFTQENALLFYTSDLDPNITHTFSITNQGGTLNLLVNGSTALSTGNPSDISPSPSPSVTPIGASSTSSGLSSGTKAALALAGILGFLLITAFLFFFLVWRPRRQRQKRARRTVRQNLRVGEPILDIGPDSYGGPRQTSEFERWKDEMSGEQNGSKDLRNLGLVFRHTPSPKKDKQKVSTADLNSTIEDEEERSARSFSFGPSPRNGSRNGSKAGSKNGSNGSGSIKSWFSGKRKGSSSSNPSYTIDLPPLHSKNGSNGSRGPSDSQSPQVQSQASHQLQPRSSFSEITSLSYLSTSHTSDPSHRFSFNRPEEGSSSLNLHERTDSQGLLLINDSLRREREEVETLDEAASGYQPTVSTQAPQVYIQEVASSYNESIRSPPISASHGLSRSISARTGTGSVRSDVEWGSVRTYDDSVSVLGASTARAAIRGLSPRTSEATFNTFGVGRGGRSEEGYTGNLGSVEEAPMLPPALVGNPRERVLSDSTVRGHDPRVFVDVQPSSPFTVEFGRADVTGGPGMHRRGNSTGSVPRPNRLSVRFEETQPQAGPSGSGAEIKPLPQPPKALFRLTPLNPTATSSTPEPDSPSFLDFGAGSSSASHTTGSGSNDQSSSSHSRLRYSSSISQRPLGARSRWSSTTPSSGLGRQDSVLTSDSQTQSSSQPSVAVSSPSFPFPVSLPASPYHPEGHKPSPPRQTSALAFEETTTSQPETAGVHPAIDLTSPTESVPMSISDLHFRHSDSEEAMDNDNGVEQSTQRLPPHPPLPSSVPPTPTFPLTDTSGSGSTPQAASVVPSYVASTSGSASGSGSGSTTVHAPSLVTSFQGRHGRTSSLDPLSPVGRRPLGPRDSKQGH